MRRRRIFGVLVALLMGVTSVADGHIATFPTRIRRTDITIEGNLVTRLAGVVRSTKPRCERNRTVVVYHGDMRFGSTTTDADGNWVIEDLGFVDRVYKYTVYPSRIGRLPHRHMCATGRRFETIEAPDEDPEEEEF
jgi:hypothetical protein